MVIDETGIRGSNALQDFVAGHDNMVNHARALVLRDRNHPSVIRWSQANEPNISGQDSEQFEKDLYAAVNGADGTRPDSVEKGPGGSPNQYPSMTYANFAVRQHGRGRVLHPSVRPQWQGARRQRRQQRGRPATATVDGQRRHEPAVAVRSGVSTGEGWPVAAGHPSVTEEHRAASPDAR